MDAEALAHEAARLQVAEQHARLDRIVDALASGAERDVAAAWDQEIARRIDDLDRGVVESVPWAEVQRRLHPRRASR